MGSELKDQAAKVLIHPLLLVRVAASGVIGELRLGSGLDPQPCRTEDVDQVRDGVGALGQGDLIVPVADVGERTGREILFAQRGPILFGPLDGISDWPILACCWTLYEPSLVELVAQSLIKRVCAFALVATCDLNSETASRPTKVLCCLH